MQISTVEHDKRLRKEVIEELRNFIDKNYENIFFELKSTERIEGPNRVLDKFIKQLKERNDV